MTVARRRLPALLTGLVAIACAGDGKGPVACLFTNEECIEDARLDGREVLLVDTEGNPVDHSGTVVTESNRATIPAGDPFWRLQAGETLVEEALLAFGRGPTCALVRSDPPFHVRLTATEEPWVAGPFSGMLACPDYSALPVSGAFRVMAQEEG